MKLSAFDGDYSFAVSQGGTVLVSSTGSNAGLTGGDVLGEPGDYAVVGLRRQVSIQSNITPVSVGDVLTIVQASPAEARFATPSNSAPGASHSSNVAIVAVFDGGGSAISVGAAVDLHVPFPATITAATSLADVSTSSVVAVWKDTYANYPPTIADAITGANPPTIGTATKAQDTALSGWSTSVAAGDTLRFSVASNNNATRLTVSLSAAKGT